ncbi:MAG: hypothetical protein OEU36_12265 [Gammaproteobacteria bacterium]|nr:hypothetical protein [Gammaproteobacteria bacterium]
MSPIALLFLITILYAGYNLLVKVSSNYVPLESTSTILATICLQVAALAASTSFAVVLLLRGGHVLQLSTPTYTWAIAAGLCIGAAEIGYFYLFSGVMWPREAMSANVAIPTIVSGTIVITVIVSFIVFRESLSWIQFLGSLFVVGGIVMLFIGKS